MRILVRYAPPFRRWHRALATHLERAGHDPYFEAYGRTVGRVLLRAERLVYRIKPDADARAVPPRVAEGGEAADLAVDLSGNSLAGTATIVFEVAGRRGEPGLIAAACAGKAPCVRAFVVGDGEPRLLAEGRPAIEDALVAARAFETMLPRIVTLLVAAVSAFANTAPRPVPRLCDEDAPGPRLAPVRFFIDGLAAKIRSRVSPARGRPDHWQIGLRRVGGGEDEILPDVQGRFRADPFLFSDAGRLWLFAEDFPYATGKGVITCQTVGTMPPGAGNGHGASEAKGHGDMPRTVLEEPFHLSYPLVIRHGDAVYMMPESAAASRVMLYRADPFPWRWVPARQLIAGRLADATPIRHEGRWWLFATSIEDGGSSWDQLHLYHAADLLGPWSPHPKNPVLIDAAGARPAGHMWHENGVLLRPVQDCRRSYGGGVRIFEIVRLDEGGYEQRPVRNVDPPPGRGFAGLHTINREAGWEAFDVKVPRG